MRLDQDWHLFSECKFLGSFPHSFESMLLLSIGAKCWHAKTVQDTLYCIVCPRGLH